MRGEELSLLKCPPVVVADDVAADSCDFIFGRCFWLKTWLEITYSNLLDN